MLNTGTSVTETRQNDAAPAKNNDADPAETHLFN
jgi:hypothetical protein